METAKTMRQGEVMKRILAVFLLGLICLGCQPGKAAAFSGLFGQTDWDSLAAGIYGNYIFYKTDMQKPNIYYFQQAMRQCDGDLRESLRDGGADGREMALLRFKNLVAIALVGLAEMNKYAAVDNFNAPARDIMDNLRDAFQAMRAKNILSGSESDFVRGFRNLEESGMVAAICAEAVKTQSFHAHDSVLQIEYLKYNENIQHALFFASNGKKTCSWAGNCFRLSGNRLKCDGILGSHGGFTGIDENGSLVIHEQDISRQCGFSAMAGVYREE